MDYCSLDDAFKEINGAPSPGCAMDYSSKAARKEERRRARKCKTGAPVAANYLQLEKDPDRQHLNPLPDVEAMNPVRTEEEEGFFHHGNQWLHSNEQSSTVRDKSSPEYDRDPLHKYVQDEERGHLMVVPVNGDHVTNKRRFFGASGPDEEFFADYQPDQEDYRLQPDFTKAFDLGGLDRAGSGPTSLPAANANVAWKPLSKGVPSSFYDKLTLPKGSYVRKADRMEEPSSSSGDMSNQEIMKRMDVLFARLDDLHQTTPERMTSEMLMFISTGIFVMFMMDVLVKKGSQLRF